MTSTSAQQPACEVCGAPAQLVAQRHWAHDHKPFGKPWYMCGRNGAACTGPALLALTTGDGVDIYTVVRPVQDGGA